MIAIVITLTGTKNDAFTNDPHGTTAGALKDAAAKVLAGDCEHGGAALYDVNGARLGTVTVDRGEDEEDGQ